MFKYRIIVHRGDKIIQRLSDTTFIPFDTNNRDYVQVLKDLMEFGPSIIELPDDEKEPTN